MSTTPQSVDIDVHDDPDNDRYVAVVDGEVAGYADYRDEQDHLVFPHTVVEDDWGGRGVGSALVRGTLDDVRRRGRQVVPECTFFAGYIDKHPEYQDLVSR